MLLASAHVIAHRTARMMVAGPAPSAADRREFYLMSSEKVAAAVDSSRAIMSQVIALNVQLWSWIVTSPLAVTTAFVAFNRSRTCGDALARHASLVRALARSSSAAARLSHATARLADRGLAPIHARAIANSRRLRKR